MCTDPHALTQLQDDAETAPDAADTNAADDANADSMTHVGAHSYPLDVKMQFFIVVKGNAPCA